MSQSTRVLYIDDEANLRILVKDQLVAEGFTVETADDGDTGVEVLKKQKFDVVLLDIRMPRMGGIDVLKYIKEHKVPCRIIMLTAVDDLSVALESVKNGANDYLTKPYDLETLLASIRRVISA
jgi:DNA-binding response OmpR family regulator